jgi:hypothetical protein
MCMICDYLIFDCENHPANVGHIIYNNLIPKLTLC